MTDTKSILPFEFQAHKIRVIIKNDNPLFVAIDICNTLGITDTHMALKKLDEDEKMKVPKSDLGVQAGGEMWIVNESGLYALIMRSNKPEARAFRKWVTSEVLPALRRTGSYTVANRYPDADVLLEMMEKAADICGSYAKLAKRVGTSSGHITSFTKRKFERISREMYERVWHGCEMILEHGAGYDTEMVDMIMQIEDNNLRLKMFNKLKKDGIL